MIINIIIAYIFIKIYYIYLSNLIQKYSNFIFVPKPNTHISRMFTFESSLVSQLLSVYLFNHLMNFVQKRMKQNTLRAISIGGPLNHSPRSRKLLVGLSDSHTQSSVCYVCFTNALRYKIEVI